MSSTKERMRTAPRTLRAVEVNGQTYYVRALTLRELDALDGHAQGTHGSARALRYAYGLFASAVCEADGSRVYTAPDDPDIEDVPGDVFRGLNDAAAKLNGIGDADDDQGND